MHPKTLKALQGSIKKWERIVAGTGKDKGSENCPLCRRFLNQGGFCAVYDDDTEVEEECPVVIDGVGYSCRETPYDAWLDAHTENGRVAHQSKIYDDDSAIAAVLELEFLRSLLPNK